MNADSPQPVLLLHGFASTAEETFGRTGWLRVLARAGMEPIAPDLPGHGSSSLPAPSSREELEAWAVQELEKAASRYGSPVRCIGYSLGSALVWTAALKRPELTGGLALAGVPEHDHLADLGRGVVSPSTEFLTGLIAQSGSAERLAPLIAASARDPFSAHQLMASGQIPAGLALVAAGSEDGLALAPQALADAAEEAGRSRPRELVIEGRDHITALTSGLLRSAAAAALGSEGPESAR